MASTIIARATTFVVLVLMYIVFLLSVMGYYELAPSFPPQTSTTSTTIATQKKPSTSLPQKINIAPSAVNVQRPDYSPLVGLHFKSSSRSDETIHIHPVIFDDLDSNQSYSDIVIIPRRSIISPEPVVTRSRLVVRNVVSWAWAYASKGVISTYNDAFRVGRQARHVLV